MTYYEIPMRTLYYYYYDVKTQKPTHGLIAIANQSRKR